MLSRAWDSGQVPLRFSGHYHFLPACSVPQPPRESNRKRAKVACGSQLFFIALIDLSGFSERRKRRTDLATTSGFRLSSFAIGPRPALAGVGRAHMARPSIYLEPFGLSPSSTKRHI
jgi:hypothetical protein